MASKITRMFSSRTNQNVQVARIKKKLNDGHGVKRGEVRKDLRRVNDLLQRADALAGS